MPPFDRFAGTELATTDGPLLTVLDQAYGPRRGYPLNTGMPLSTDALLYGNQPGNVPLWGGNPAGNFYNTGFYGSRLPFANQGFNLQNLAYSLPMIMNGLSGGYGGGPFGNGGYGGGRFGYGGGILPLAMGLGGLFGGGRGFRLGGLLGLGSMALFGLGRRFLNGRFNCGGGGNGGWDCAPRPQPRPMPFDGGDLRPSPDGGDNSAEEAQLVALINQARGDSRTLLSNSGLQQAAGFMALQMQGKTLRNDPGMHNLDTPGMEAVRTPADRIATIGKVKAGATGECMAQGRTAQQVFDMLMADPPHRAILMSGAYNSIGVKRVGNMWVLDFARV